MVTDDLKRARDIPLAVREAAEQQIKHYTVGFVSVKDPNEPEIRGSGTLIKLGSVRAILTAEHVVRDLQKHEELGLVISEKEQRPIFISMEFHFLPIARGNVDSDGPDIAIVFLSSNVASTLEAQKSFLNLDTDLSLIRNSPPTYDRGFGYTAGYRGVFHQDQGKCRGFTLQIGFGQIKASSQETDEYDYLDFPVSFKVYTGNNDFSGLSGGGVWHVLFELDNEPRITKMLLSGVIYYQTEPDQTSCRLICHGRKSIYKTVYNLLQDRA